MRTRTGWNGVAADLDRRAKPSRVYGYSERTCVLRNLNRSKVLKNSIASWKSLLESAAPGIARVLKYANTEKVSYYLLVIMFWLSVKWRRGVLR
jgi:hypothetical protein